MRRGLAVGISLGSLLVAISLAVSISIGWTNDAQSLDHNNYLPVVIKQPTPTPTFTPTPTMTPIPTMTPTPGPTSPTGPDDPYFSRVAGATYHGTLIHRLDACENHGMLRADVYVLDKNGNPLNGVNILMNTPDNRNPAYGITGDKAPGMEEFVLQAGDAGGGNWHFLVADGPSDTAWNIRTDLWLNEYCGDSLGVFHGHISYDIYFQKTN